MDPDLPPPVHAPDRPHEVSIVRCVECGERWPCAHILAVWRREKVRKEAEEELAVLHAKVEALEHKERLGAQFKAGASEGIAAPPPDADILAFTSALAVQLTTLSQAGAEVTECRIVLHNTEGRHRIRFEEGTLIYEYDPDENEDDL